MSGRQTTDVRQSAPLNTFSVSVRTAMRIMLSLWLRYCTATMNNGKRGSPSPRCKQAARCRAAQAQRMRVSNARHVSSGAAQPAQSHVIKEELDGRGRQLQGQGLEEGHKVRQQVVVLKLVCCADELVDVVVGQDVVWRQRIWRMCAGKLKSEAQRNIAAARQDARTYTATSRC